MRAMIPALVVALWGVQAQAAEPESGEHLFERYCASCHGTNGKGDTRLARLFEVGPPDLTRIALRQGGWFPEATIREIIDGRYAAHGRREMPVWGSTLTPPQLVAITEHLRSLQEREPG